MTTTETGFSFPERIMVISSGRDHNARKTAGGWVLECTNQIITLAHARPVNPDVGAGGRCAHCEVW
jgi:hypothetical protein